MELKLVPVTAENWRQAAFLSTAPGHVITLDEEWVTSNVWSILQTIYEPNWTCRLILDGETPVGFVFFGQGEIEGVMRPMLCRFMIDIDYQGKGYGRAALPLALREMYRLYGSCDVRLGVDPRNQRAIRLYESFGFRPSGEMDEDEVIYLLPAPKEG